MMRILSRVGARAKNNRLYDPTKPRTDVRATSSYSSGNLAIPSITDSPLGLIDNSCRIPWNLPIVSSTGSSDDVSSASMQHSVARVWLRGIVG